MRLQLLLLCVFIVRISTISISHPPPPPLLGFVKILFRSFWGKRSRRSPLSHSCGVCSTHPRLQTAESPSPTRLSVVTQGTPIFLTASARINRAPENELCHPSDSAPTPRCGESTTSLPTRCPPTFGLRTINEMSKPPFLPPFLSYSRAAIISGRITLCHTHHMAPMSPHHPVLNGYWRVLRYRAVGQDCGCVYMLISFSFVKLTVRASSACLPVFIYPRILLIPLPLPQLCTK